MIKAVSLPNSGRITSQLGFGCAFWASTSEHDVARILDAAYDAGIRHFDVAPYYLNGEAEVYLGKFLSKHADASVTTKYGLLPNSTYESHVRLMRLFLKPIVKLMRGRANLPLQAKILAISRGKAKFSREEMERSLKQSSIFLKRGYVDIFLFHEPDGDDLSNDGLLESAGEQIARGCIGAVGVGGESERAVEAFRKFSGAWDVMQYDWSAFSGELFFPSAFQVIYWVVTRNFRETWQLFLQDDDLVRECSEVVDLDLREPGTMRALLFKAALLANKDGITLFYSSKIEHIHHNVAIAENCSIDEKARRFLDFAMTARPERLRRIADDA